MFIDGYHPYSSQASSQRSETKLVSATHRKGPPGTSAPFKAAQSNVQLFIPASFSPRYPCFCHPESFNPPCPLQSPGVGGWEQNFEQVPTDWRDCRVSPWLVALLCAPSIGFWRQGSYGSCLGAAIRASVPPHCFPGSCWGNMECSRMDRVGNVVQLKVWEV